MRISCDAHDTPPRVQHFSAFHIIVANGSTYTLLVIKNGTQCHQSGTRIHYLVQLVANGSTCMLLVVKNGTKMCPSGTSSQSIREPI